MNGEQRTDIHVHVYTCTCIYMYMYKAVERGGLKREGRRYEGRQKGRISQGERGNSPVRGRKTMDKQIHVQWNLSNEDTSLIRTHLQDPKSMKTKHFTP